MQAFNMHFKLFCLALNSYKITVIINELVLYISESEKE